jgi:penicillin-binding protein 1B
MSSLVVPSRLKALALKKPLVTGVALLTLTIIAFIAWLYSLDRQITERLSEGRFAPAVEFYAAPSIIRPGYNLPPDFVEQFIRRRRFIARPFKKAIDEGEFSQWNSEQCASVLTDLRNVSIGKCIAFRNANSLPGEEPVAEPLQVVAFEADGRHVAATYSGSPLARSKEVVLEPELFAQYYGDRPILREEVPLANAPAQCLNALLAIEDSKFLEHSGISLSSLARAGWSIIRHRRVTQGGSTLTQQTVKNFFLTEERTLARKIPEFFMSLLLEGRLDKDKILEIYINTIYMGQNGVFEVRGFGSAARHYFGSDLQDLDLPQCALIAGVLNSPGLYDPFNKPENALKRRNRVLEKMRELNFIEQDELTTALATPLPSKPQRGLTEPAPYFVQTVRRILQDKGIDESEGLRIYTTLDLRAQEAAFQAVREGLDRLETKDKKIIKLKEQGKNLEAVLLSSDPSTGYVQALVGGRGFKRSPYNRAFDSMRQVGSVMKPFVFLTALESLDKDGKPYNALTMIEDQPFTHKYAGQTWSPRNYDSQYRGEVPLYYALKESLNAATARLGIDIGLGNIVDVAKRMGISSKLAAFPALSLGAFELHPWEVLQSYGTIANLGRRVPVIFVLRVESLGGDLMFEAESEPEQAVAPENVSQLIGMMEQVLISGTGGAARGMGFMHPAAGKTGTTNDKKDAWFGGFTPYHNAVVWVGYDDNTPHGLTGSSGAVPIWAKYMIAYATTFPPTPFAVPEGNEKLLVSVDLQNALGILPNENQLVEPIELVFRKGTEFSPPPPPDATATPFPYRPGGN